MVTVFLKACVKSLVDKIKFLIEQNNVHEVSKIFAVHTNVKNHLDLGGKVELVLTADIIHIIFGSLLKSPLINSKSRVKFLFPIISYCIVILSKNINKYQLFNDLQPVNLSEFAKTFLNDEDVFGGAYRKEKLQGFLICREVSKFDGNVLVIYKKTINYLSRSVFLSDNYINSDWKYLSFIFRYLDWGGYNKSLDYAIEKEIAWDDFKDLINAGTPIFWHKLTRLPYIKSNLLLPSYPAPKVRGDEVSELFSTNINVDLSGLQSFDEHSLSFLCEKEHGCLILDGISEFANSVQRFDFNLFKFICFNPSFSGLEDPELDFLINLSQNTHIKEITLDGVKTLTPNLKIALPKFHGKKINLRGIGKLSESDVSVFSDIDVVFECLTHISAETAKEIGKLKRVRGLNFPCLKNIDEETAKAMSEWPPCSVGIFSPVSDKTLKVLMDAVNFNELWLNYEIPNEQVSFIKKNAINKSIKFPLDILSNIDTSLSAFTQNTFFQKNKEIKLNLGKDNFIFLTFVPAGKFLMGPGDDSSYQTVTISKPFYMSKNVVTQRQWLAVMHNNPSEILGENLPVVNVSWLDCQLFIRKLNEITKQHFRLPTEAEWEYACRAGTRSNFFFGDELLPEHANFDNGFIGTLSEVGKFKQNAFGLNDMHGNVFEWCNDWFGKYSSCNVIDPQGPMDGIMKVSRGGSFCSQKHTRSYSRHYSFPHYKSCTIGLRLVLSDK